jgi:hypothetical protein
MDSDGILSEFLHLFRQTFRCLYIDGFVCDLKVLCLEAMPCP